MKGTPQFQVMGRLGRSPRERANRCALQKTCPDIFALSTGDFAFIGKDITAEIIEHLPGDAGCGPHERVVLLPREVVLAAKADIPDA